MSRRSFGSVRKKSANKYQARYRDKAGRDHYRVFTTKGAATAFLANVEADMNRGEWVSTKEARQVTYERWVERWWPAHAKTLRPSTADRDRGYLDRYVMPTFGTTPLLYVDHVAVSAWVAELSNRGLAPATVQKAYQILSKTLRGAVVAKVLPASPCHDVELPKVEDREARFLDSDELLALEAAMPDRWKDVVPFLADVGLRIGELAALRWRDVDMLRLTVAVRDTLTEVPTVHIGPPKTQAGRRSIPTLTPETAERLAVRMGNAGPDGFVFAAVEGGPLLPNGWRERVWRPAVRRAGLEDPQPTPHALRHSAVAHWIAIGVTDAFKLQRWAGHRSISTIYRVYGHLLPVDATQERAALSAMRAAARERAAEKLAGSG